MKKKYALYLTIFCFFGLLPLSAQITYEKILDGTYPIIHAADVDDDGHLVAGGSRFRCHQASLWRFSPDGGLLWSIQPLEDGYARFTDVVYTSEGHILAAAQWSIADDIGGLDVRVVKTDTFGNVLFSTVIVTEPVYEPAMVRELPDGRYLIVHNAQLYWLDQEGELLNSLDMQTVPFSDFELWGNNRIVLLHEYGILVLNLEGEGVEFIGDDISYKAIHTSGDTLWFVDNLSLNYYDPSTMQIPETIFLEGFYEWTGLTSGEGGILIWGRDAETEHPVVRLIIDSDIVGEVYTLPHPRFSIDELIVVDQSIFLSGQERFELEASQYQTFQSSYIKRLWSGFTEPLQAPIDIGVSNLELLEISNIDTLKDLGNGQYILWAYYELEVEVTNYGQRPVDRFILASEYLNGFNCSEHRIIKYVEEPDFLPGESMTVPVQLSDYYPSSQEYCFFTAAPNDNFDDDFSNNKFCSLLSSVEETAPTFIFRIFPNPSDRQVYFDAGPDNVIRSIQFFDLAGRLIRSLEEINAGLYTFNRKDIPAGMYLARIRTKQGLAIRKVVLR